MTRNIDRSPFDAAQQSDKDDWLEDTERKPSARVAEEPFERQYTDADPGELESRLETLKAELESLKSAEKLRNKIGDAKGAKATEGRVKFLEVEQRVIERFLRTASAGEVEDVIVPTVEAEPSEEETAENIAKTDRAKRQGYLAAAKEVQAKREKEQIAKREEAEMDRLVEEAKAHSGETIMHPVQKEKELKMAQQVEAFEKSFLGESANLSEAEAIRRDMALGKDLSARERPESGWSRFKRGLSDLFGQSSPKMKPEAPIAKPPQEEPVRFEQDIRSKGVISARTEPPKKQPGFFARLWKSMSVQAQRKETFAGFQKNVRGTQGDIPKYAEGVTQADLQRTIRERFPKKKQPADEEKAA